MTASFEAKGSEVTVRLPEEHIVGLLALAALDGSATLADQIRKATNGYLGSSLKDPDFSDEVAAARERLASEAKEA